MNPNTRTTDELKSILSNLTFIVGMAHVKATKGEITTEQATERTHTELDQAEEALQLVINKAIIEARIDELTQLAEFELVDGIKVFGRHDRSYKDRISALKETSK